MEISRRSFVGSLATLAGGSLISPNLTFGQSGKNLGLYGKPDFKQFVKGKELARMENKGWFAACYPAWAYDPSHAPIHPVPELFTPGRSQYPRQIQYQSRQLNDYGSALDIISFLSNPVNSSFNYYRNNYFGIANRPFMVLEEHLDDPAYSGPVGAAKDMDDPRNQQAFFDSLAFWLENVVYANPDYYIVMNGEPVTYYWNTNQMLGESGRVIREAKKMFRFKMIGGEGIGSDPQEQDIDRLASLDGFMTYSTDWNNFTDYNEMVATSVEQGKSFKDFLAKNVPGAQEKTLFGTFTASFDDHLSRGGKNNILYPRSREEMENFCQVILDGQESGYISRCGPMAVYSELFEGSSVCETEIREEEPGRYVGYGTGRLELLRDYFGN
jgi:hypothetical protein